MKGAVTPTRGYRILLVGGTAFCLDSVTGYDMVVYMEVINMIEVSNLSKIYKLTARQRKKLRTKDNKKMAVSEVSFVAREGEIYGLLGPNGAGKTTALRCLATLLKPTTGEIFIQGEKLSEKEAFLRERMAFLTNEIQLDPNFTPAYLFRFFGRLHGMSEEEINARKQELFSYFQITEFENKLVEELSTGMKQKASIAVSLVHNPDIIIFDEPTNGLDIITARKVTDYLLKLREQGKLIIISTHIMSEAQRLCDRIGIIINGRKVLEGSLEEILEQGQADNLEDAFFRIYIGEMGEEGSYEEK